MAWSRSWPGTFREGMPGHRTLMMLWHRRFFVDAVESPHTFDELRSAIYGRALKPLVRHLVDEIHYPGVVSALL